MADSSKQEKIIWFSSGKKTKYSDHYNLLIESGLYREEPVPPVVDLKDKESEVIRYYLTRLQERYVGTIVIKDMEKVFISKDN